eukprot:g32099.t1
MANIRQAPQAPERLDWMYEQSAASVKPNDDEKAAKKEKKAAKKEEKALKKASKKKKKSSSSSSSEKAQTAVPAKREREAREAEPDLSALGPSQIVVSKRLEHESRVKQQKDAALASRGLGKRMTDEEKEQRVQQMRVDAKKHERMKDDRIASAEEREKQIEDA